MSWPLADRCMAGQQSVQQRVSTTNTSEITAYCVQGWQRQSRWNTIDVDLSVPECRVAVLNQSICHAHIKLLIDALIWILFAINVAPESLPRQPS